MNLYRTAGNNPLNSLDPTGLFWYPGKYLIQLRREYDRGLELDRQINERRARQGLPQLEPPPHWTSVAAAEIGDGLRIGLQANVNAAATATRSLVTLGLWAEPWEVWAVADEDRPYYEGGFLAARVGWELLPSYGIGKLTQVPGQVGRWGRYALSWDTAQNAVQVGRGGYDIYENGLNWANGLQVGTGLLGLGGNYTSWRRASGSAPTSATFNSIDGSGAAGSGGGWSWGNWFKFWEDRGGVTQLEATGSIPFFRRYRVVAYRNWDLPGTPGFLDTAAHEGTHIAFGWYFPQLIDAGRLPLLGGPFNFIHETIAYSVGRIAAGRIHALPLAPYYAFR